MVTSGGTGAPGGDGGRAEPGLRVRRARRIEELEAVAELQARIWGSWEVAAPATLLKAMAEAGGLALLAWLGPRPVGFVFGFTGRDREGRPYHRSHAAGVLPEVRDKGVGRALKMAQRRHSLALGLDRMVWTFDPSQLRNAHFNLHRLGAVARSFHADYYGVRTDAINQGRPSDRLVVEWFLDRPRQVELNRVRRLAGAQLRVPEELAAERFPAPAAHRQLRRQLVAALGSGMALVDYDREAAAYSVGPLPSSFPPPAE